jgi:hypothetical protein
MHFSQPGDWHFEASLAGGSKQHLAFAGLYDISSMGYRINIRAPDSVAKDVPASHILHMIS